MTERLQRIAPVPVSSTLQVFHDPRNVVVVGASEAPNKWGYWMARGALSAAGRRPAYLVNRRGVSIGGTASYRALDALPDAPDLVVLCVPGAAIPGVVGEAIMAGARGFVCISADVGELEPEVARLLTAGGARMIGPNCMGLHDTSADLRLVWGELASGRVALVSQSGGLASEVVALLTERKQGVSRVVSLGNQLDVGAGEELAALLGRADTDFVGVYLEDYGAGRALVKTLAQLREEGKYVAVMSVGRSKAAQATVASHTGAITTGAEVVEAACRAAGAAVVRTPTEMADLATLVLGRRYRGGRRIGVLSDGGGQAAVASDCLESSCLEVPPLSADTASQLAELLPPHAATRNPVDLAGAGEHDINAYTSTGEILCTSGELDAVLISGYFGNYAVEVPSLGQDELAVARQLSAIADRTGVPVLVHATNLQSPTAEELRDHGISVFGAVEHAARTLGSAAALFASAPRSLDGASQMAPLDPPPTPSYWTAREALIAAGLQFPDGRLVRDRQDLHTALRQLSLPVALKADWLTHKTDVGGVALHLAHPAAVEAAYDDMLERFGPLPFVIESMDRREHVVECVVATHWDENFGAVATVGLGGSQIEIYVDVAHSLAPVIHQDALAMVNRLRGASLLRAWRGRPALDCAALAEVVVRLSAVAAASPRIAEIELNPVRVSTRGAIAVDALLIARSSHHASGDANGHAPNGQDRFPPDLVTPSERSARG